MKAAYEAVRIEPISVNMLGTAAGGGAFGSTICGGVVNVTNGIGDFSIVCGVVPKFGTAAVWSTNSATWVNNVGFALYEATAATSAGSAVAGATLSLGCATAGTLRGVYDAVIRASSNLATTVKITINGIGYHLGSTKPDGSDVCATLAGIINGQGTIAGLPKLPHYHAYTTQGGFSGDTGALYLCPDDDQATGLTIQMDAVADTVVAYWNKAQGVINVNAHALSTNTPKFLSVQNATFAGCSAAVYAFLVRKEGARTPGALVSLNT